MSLLYLLFKKISVTLSQSCKDFLRWISSGLLIYCVLRRRELPQPLRDSSKKPKVSSPSGREPLVSANFGHRFALLSEEGVSDSWRVVSWNLHSNYVLHSMMTANFGLNPITACPDEEFAEFFKDCKQSLSRPTESCAPSKNRANYSRCNSCRRLRAGTPSVTCGDSSLQLREPRFVLIWRLS